MKDKVNQLFKDKLFLVMMVIGLLTAVAAVGVLTVGSTDENGQSPYLEVPGGELMAKENGQNGADQENTGDNAQAAAEASQEDPKAFAQKNTDENAGNNPLTDNENTAENKNTGNDLAAEAGAGKQAAKALVLNFTDTSSLTWPVRGNVILDYSMDQTTYFPTLDQYKLSPAIAVGAVEGAPVVAAVNGKVYSIEQNAQTGTTLTMELGNGYQAVYGQLTDLTVSEGDTIKKGTTIGYIAQPTKYYSTEGTNLYFAMKKDGEPIDPIEYLP